MQCYFAGNRNRFFPEKVNRYRIVEAVDAQILLYIMKYLENIDISSPMLLVIFTIVHEMSVDWVKACSVAEPNSSRQTRPFRIEINADVMMDVCKPVKRNSQKMREIRWVHLFFLFFAHKQWREENGANAERTENEVRMKTFFLACM